MRETDDKSWNRKTKYRLSSSSVSQSIYSPLTTPRLSNRHTERGNKTKPVSALLPSWNVRIISFCHTVDTTWWEAYGPRTDSGDLCKRWHETHKWSRLLPRVRNSTRLIASDFLKWRKIRALCVSGELKRRWCFVYAADSWISGHVINRHVMMHSVDSALGFDWQAAWPETFKPVH